LTVVRGKDGQAGQGEVLWPPPPVQVSASPTGGPAAAPAAKERVETEPKRPLAPATKLGLVLVALAAFFLVNAFAPAPIPQHFTVLALAIVIGYYVIGKVHHALHTPLMSVTNAISGVVIVGALVQFGRHSLVVSILAGIAIVLASINIVGGFAVTRRMLSMFTTDPKAAQTEATAR
jgi:NAD(P) transhydrogenase subunit alpha